MSSHQKVRNAVNLPSFLSCAYVSLHCMYLICYQSLLTSLFLTISFNTEAMLKTSDEFVKYALIDQGAELRGKKITLKLMWDHMPLTGRLYVHEEGNKSFTLPDEYTTSK